MQLSNINTDLILRLQQKANDLGMTECVKKRLEYLAYYCQNGRCATTVCEHFSIARGTFYRVIDRLDPENLKSIEDHPRIHLHNGSVISPELIALIQEYKTKFPGMGREKIHLLLFAEHGIAVSASTVGRIIDRTHCCDTEVSSEPSKELTQGVDIFSAKHSYMTCACFLCRCKKKYVFLKLRPKFLMMSIVLNILVLGSLLGTILWESNRGIDTELPLHTAAPETVISLDTPSQQ